MQLLQLLTLRSRFCLFATSFFARFFVLSYFVNHGAIAATVNVRISLCSRFLLVMVPLCSCFLLFPALRALEQLLHSCKTISLCSRFLLFHRFLLPCSSCNCLRYVAVLCFCTFVM